MTHAVLTIEHARAFAASTLAHLTCEYPNVLLHVLSGPDDAQTPAMLHPIFYGSFDWHSCVHGWWQVMRLARLFPDMAETSAIERLADTMLVPDKAAGELAYLARPGAHGFERPYGWAWLLALHRELALRPDRPWATAIAPLAAAFAARFTAYLPRLTYPVRHGLHNNTAFALVLAQDWAVHHDPTLATLIEQRARDWFAADADCAPWEPSGEDFLSPALCEAMLMGRIMPAEDFQCWFAAFLPDPFGPRAAALRMPATVSDRSDGRIAHLDGLNLSRAWCWRGIAARLRTPALFDVTIADHLAASLPHLADDYMGEHWLATFALLALGGL